MQLRILTPSSAGVLRAPSAEASCTCEHALDCRCACHSPSCDPGAEVCDVAFLADDGGLTPWGCTACTPGGGVPHHPGCEVVGWHVPIRPMPRFASERSGDVGS